MKFYNKYVFVSIALTLLMFSSCRKETCRMRHNHPEKLIKGKYSVSVRASSFYAPNTHYDTTYSNTEIEIEALDDRTIRFTDNQLLHRTTDIPYYDFSDGTFVWHEERGSSVSYDCENDYVKAEIGSYGLSYSSFTIYEGKIISHK